MNILTKRNTKFLDDEGTPTRFAKLLQTAGLIFIAASILATILLLLDILGVISLNLDRL